MKKLIAANWKMNFVMADAKNFVLQLLQKAQEHPDVLDKSDFLICAPFVYISALHESCKTSCVSIGAQDCSVYEQGTYTGEISAGMLKDVGCTHVICGHSDRRDNHNEDNELVRKKAEAAHNNDLVAVICVGESRSERNANLQNEVVERQILESVPKSANAENTVIAYEPIWAISGGDEPCKDVPDSNTAGAIHGFIRSLLKEHYDGGQNMRILYGGSMNPDNAQELLSTPNVDGGLIGGASLKVEKFFAVAQEA